MTDIPTPIISVILPVYNRRHVIMRALNSVEQQSFRNYELLIVDDGSTDGLETVVIPEVLRCPHWRYLKHTNRKVAWSRNIGIRAALGEFITFLDSDDEYLPEHLQLRYDYMLAHPEVDIIHGGVKIDGPEETHWVVDAAEPTQKIHINDCCVGATLFAGRKVFLESGSFPIVPYSPEYHFLQKAAGRYRIEKVAFPTYIYHTAGEDRICRNRGILKNR
ncbi:MAG TPA: glycosyltransferase family 2 protein [Bacteroidetes bacterium]|nr:glycosyltransferase family 2 protein [Bacteroidota bacterium]